jgi:hypothetical protein
MQAVGVAEAVAPLKSHFPGREAQIDELLDHLTCLRLPERPVYVSGPPSAGKTAVVLELLRALGVRHAYVNCVESARTRHVLSSILLQLGGGARRRQDGYAGGARCDSLADFLRAVPAALARRGGGPAWVVLDNAQRLAATDLLTGLMRAAAGALGLLMIGPVPWDSGRFVDVLHNVLPPTTVLFPAYNHEQLITVRQGGRAQRVWVWVGVCGWGGWGTAPPRTLHPASHTRAPPPPAELLPFAAPPPPRRRSSRRSCLPGTPPSPPPTASCCSWRCPPCAAPPTT